MVNPRIPDERFPNDPYVAGMDGMPPRTPQQLDADLQPDPEMMEGRSSTGRVAAFALGIAILLAAVFYGLNNSSTGNNQASNPAADQGGTDPACQPGQHGARRDDRCRDQPPDGTGQQTDRHGDRSLGAAADRPEQQHALTET